jgi:formamidopyrimidine-DNA glycosylase
VLFLAGVHPSIPANEVPAEKVQEMWDISAKLLRKGVKEGKITTVPRRGARRNAKERVFVYQRDRHACRQCGGAISMGESANRTLWWCETCQPRSGAEPLA